MSAHQRDHTSNEDYDSLTAALIDANRVLADLADLAEGRTVVAVDDFVFLAGRARTLVTACLRAADGQ